MIYTWDRDSYVILLRHSAGKIHVQMHPFLEKSKFQLIVVSFKSVSFCLNCLSVSLKGSCFPSRGTETSFKNEAENDIERTLCVDLYIMYN